jgi:hypothetical protein
VLSSLRRPLRNLSGREPGTGALPKAEYQHVLPLGRPVTTPVPPFAAQTPLRFLSRFMYCDTDSHSNR